jgi:hypothetical protein
LEEQRAKKSKLYDFADADVEDLQEEINQLSITAKEEENAVQLKIQKVQNDREAGKTAATAEYDKELALLVQKQGQDGRALDYALMAAGEAKDAWAAENARENPWEKSKAELKKQLDELQGKQEMIQEAQEN